MAGTRSDWWIRIVMAGSDRARREAARWPHRTEPRGRLVGASVGARCEGGGGIGQSLPRGRSVEASVGARREAGRWGIGRSPTSVRATTPQPSPGNSVVGDFAAYTAVNSPVTARASMRVRT
jgi:hypothetical protein